MYGLEVEAVVVLKTHPECNVSAIAKKCGVDRKRIREWNKQFDKLLDSQERYTIQSTTKGEDPPLSMAI